MIKDIAHFDSPKAESGFPDQVQVIRDGANAKGGVNSDQLVCDHLMLKFRRKAEQAGSAKSDGPGSNREIESAHATAHPGGEVVLALDSENLDCRCIELIYQGPTSDRGARTVLRGEPLFAAKDGHRIKARELQLVAANEKGAGQQIIAQGPGQVDLLDRRPAKGHTTHALWRGLLTSAKYKDGDRDIDVLTFTEDAAFIEDENGQRLIGQQLKVWLEPSEAPVKVSTSVAKQDLPNTGPRQRPWKVEAYERVKAESADLRSQ